MCFRGPAVSSWELHGLFTLESYNIVGRALCSARSFRVTPLLSSPFAATFRQETCITPSAVVDDKLTVRGVNFWYGSKQALFDISLAIPERSVTAFIGPSGCGKSTLLRLLNRMNDLIEGTRLTGQVLLDGQDVYASGLNVVDLRRRVG